ncbi:MAG: TolC family protein [Pseudomonadota bacterium]
MTRRSNKVVLCVLWLVLLVGCVQAPHVELVPEALRTQPAPDRASSVPMAAWWQPLHDPVLSGLIDAALRDSPSTQIAEARINQAQLQIQIARGSLWPSIGAQGRRDVMNFSDNTVDTRADLGALSLNWDAGLWGRRRLQIYVAKCFSDQRWFEAQQVALLLSTQVADTYFQIVEGYTQGDLLAEQMRVSRDLEDLIEARFRLGQAAASELYQQREQTAVLKQLSLVNDANAEVLERRLDVLLGAAPDRRPRVLLRTLPAAPAATPARAPQDLVRSRADIRAGFAQLRQIAAEAGIGITDRLPALRVNLGLASLANKATSTQLLSHGLDLTAPLFTGGRLRATQKSLFLALEEARQRYYAIWLGALEEISVTRWRFDQQSQIIVASQERRRNAQLALGAARNRYALGNRNFLDVLTALRGLQDADRQLNTQRRELLTLWIRAIEASGRPVFHEALCDDLAGCRERWES